MSKKKTSITPKNLGNLKLSKLIPLTDAQKDAFDFFLQDNHLILYGSAGTGKTFIALGLSLEDVFDKEVPQDKIIIVRSVVPTRDVGYLPGNIQEKSAIYELPYKQICSELFKRGDAYEILKNSNVIDFITTSFVRGITMSNAIVIVDEFQNLTIEEIHTIVTRLGENSRIVFCGDTNQTDFGVGGKKLEKSGFTELLEITRYMNHFREVQFDKEDIVRAEIVKEWIIARDKVRS